MSMIAEREPVAESGVERGRVYAELAAGKLRLTDRSLVVGLASNDGRLLQHFVKLGMRVLGATEFFGVDAARRLSAEHGRADLIVGNNVLAQVPDLNDFVGGIPLLLAWNGTLTLEFPQVARPIQGNQFDTIDDEHFSYFSLYTTERIFAKHGLRVYDVEELPTHGGSVRVWGCHAADPRQETSRLRGLRERGPKDEVDQLQDYGAPGTGNTEVS